MNPLAIIPAFVRSTVDLDLVTTTIDTMLKTTEDLDLLVVDDCSPDEEVRDALVQTVESYGGEIHLKKINEGFSKTVNIGLRRALREKRDAVLVNADMEFTNDEWLGAMLRTRRSDGSGLASIVGARLVYNNDLIQHAGVYFSMLKRTFDHIYRYGPGNLPEAMLPRICPVTGALQLIRYETLAELGVYDERFRMGFEDVDYCVRAWKVGLESVYQPRAIVVHHESVFRGRAEGQLAEWQNEAWLTFVGKWGGVSFAEFIPHVI